MTRSVTSAIRVHRPGGSQELRWEELELPAAGLGEVVVRHEAIGLNFIDIYFRTGLYPPPGYPFVPGLEAAGVVEQVGSDVNDLKVGDRVAYASRPLGAYAEARVMPADRLVKLPDGISSEIGAAILLKGLTAWYLLRRTFPIGPEHTLLVHAAAGGVGSLLSQWAKQLGARVLGTVGNEEKAERAARDGCEEPIVYTAVDFPERVSELTDGEGVDVVYDSVGIDTFTGSLDCLRPLGMLVSFGQSSGAVPAIELSELASRGSLFLTRPSLMDYTARVEDLRQGAAELFELVEQGALACHIGQRFPLREAAAAHDALEGRRTSGSSVLIP